MTIHQLLETSQGLVRLGLCILLFGLFVFMLGLIYETIGTMRKNEVAKAKAGLVFYWDANDGQKYGDVRMEYAIGKHENGKLVFYPAPPNGVKFVPDENGMLRAVLLPAMSKPTD